MDVSARSCAPGPGRRIASGQVVITPAALDLLSTADVQRALARHLSGDWGDCDPGDAAANEEALVQGDRLFSVYHSADQTKFWIITEADRAATTILLPADY